ncbi:hypothetical protein NKH45_23285 [Mesorhizobium sp. M1156]|uniref:hypothetical protein n=1 Tax=unclassified Mesorhizobium TaxID=325217 RepID=UPI00333B214C
MLSVICFSKDRPLQLEAYIESLMYFGGIKPEYVTVLVACSPGISYQRLVERFPKINWVHETAFRQDLLDALSACEDYVLLGCDDVVFKDFFDVNDCIRALQMRQDVFGFSLRLGTNLNFIPAVLSEDGIFLWDWQKAKGDYWRYPWEVSASIYRRDFIRRYLEARADVTNPNRFEAFLAKQISDLEAEIPPKLACFPSSCCVTITVNRVQDEYPNEFDESKDTGAETLYREHMNGLKQNWFKLARWSNDSVHVGAEHFELVQQVDVTTVAYTAGPDRKAAARSRRFSLALKILWWRAAAVLWEEGRKRLPRSWLQFLKSAVRYVS